jgi:hypothetical protein
MSALLWFTEFVKNKLYGVFILSSNSCPVTSLQEKEEDPELSGARFESLIETSVLANTPPSQSRYIRTQEVLSCFLCQKSMLIIRSNLCQSFLRHFYRVCQASYDSGVSQHNARYPDHMHAYPDQYVTSARG